MKAIMKTMKYFLSMAALALVGAMMTGCSSDDNIIDQPQHPVNKNNLVTLTTTVSLDGGATTRALTSTGVKTFAEGETMAIYYYKNKGNDHVKAVSAPLTAGDITNGGKSATFTFTLDNPYKDMNVSYVYPAAMANDDFTPNYDALYNNQDGTLATLASNFDYCTRSGAWSGGNLPSLTLVNQLAILAITLKDANGSSDITGGTTKLTLSDGTYTYNVNRSAAEGPIYVAIRPTEDATIDITATSGGNGYYKSLSAKTYAAGNGYPVSWKRETNVQLSKLKGDYTAQNGDVLAGELAGDYAISIASGASVTLSNVTINRGNSSSRKLPGIKCNGDATITLVGSNTVNASTNGDPSTGDYAGIQVGPSYTTLTIQGEDDGSLSATGQYSSAGLGGSYAVGNDAGNIIITSGAINATGGYDGAGIGSADRYYFGTITISGGVVTAVGHGNAAGIGTGYCGTCGNITISGGTVTATGDEKAAGIGCGGDVSECGDILISGGTVTATGGSDAAGIGCGYAGEVCTNSCGDITITSGVTHVTATKGGSNEDNSTEPKSIGAGGHLIGGYDEDLGGDVEAGESICGDVNIEDLSKVTQN